MNIIREYLLYYKGGDNVGKRKDLTGLTFGNLKVLEEIPVRNRQGKILYKCEKCNQTHKNIICAFIFLT